MIAVAQPRLTFQRTLEEHRFESAALELLKTSEAIAKEFYARHFPQSDIRVSCDIEAGSTKVVITIATAVNVLVAYGSIRQSIDYLVKDAQAVVDWIAPAVPRAVGLPMERPVQVTRGTAMPGKLQRIYREVSRGRLSPEEGAARIEAAVRGGADLTDQIELDQLLIPLSVELNHAAAGAPRWADPIHGVRRAHTLEVGPSRAPAVRAALERAEDDTMREKPVPINNVPQIQAIHVGPRRIRGVRAERDEDNKIRLVLLT